MSKFRIIMATLLALAVAAPAMAFNVTWKGDFNNRFIYSQNDKVHGGFARLSNETARYANVPELNNPGLTNEDDSDADFFQGEVKYRLTLEATDDNKKVKGQWGFEIGGLEFGDEADFGGDATSVFELRFANVGFELPFDPATTATIGLQAVGLNKWVWSDTAAGIKLDSKRGPLSYTLAWFRNDYTEGGDEDPRDVYALDVKYAAEALPKLNVFALYSWEDDVTFVDGNGGLLAGKDTEIWFGAAIDGQAGPLFYGGTAIYLTGEAEGGALAQDLDRKAYFLNAEATYKLGKSRIKGAWIYASGDDDPNDGDLENYDAIDLYVPIGSVVIFDSYADDNTASSSPYIQDKGLNLLYASIDYDLSDKTTVGASYFWHNTAEDLTVEGDKDLGHEIAVRAAHKITKNLTAGIQAGYLFGGDAWEDLGSAIDDGDDIFATDASIRLKF